MHNLEIIVWPNILLASLWGGLVAMDTTAAFQIMISRPLIASSVVGLLLGDFSLGFGIGLFLELLWLNELPVGAAKFSEGNIGSAVGAAVGILATQETQRSVPSLVLALILAIVVAWIGGELVVLMRRINDFFYEKLLNSPRLTFGLVTRIHLQGIFSAFIIGFLLMMFFVAVFGVWLFPWLISFIPVSLDESIQPAGNAVLGVGCAILIHHFITKERYRFWWVSCIGALLALLFVLLK